MEFCVFFLPCFSDLPGEVDLRRRWVWIFAAVGICRGSNIACAQMPDCVLRDPAKGNLPVAAVYVSVSGVPPAVVWRFRVCCVLPDPSEGISAFSIELMPGVANRIETSAVYPNSPSEELGWKPDPRPDSTITWETTNALAAIGPGEARTFSFVTSAAGSAVTNFYAINSDCSAVGVCQSPAGYQPKVTPLLVRSACGGDSGDRILTDCGYLGRYGDVITAVPGVLCIDPGRDPITRNVDWRNLVYADYAGEPYVVKNVWLEKRVPPVFQCADRFPARSLTQMGEDNVRLLWPLMYETAGTRFALTVHYGTARPFLAPEEAIPGYSHLDTWIWEVTTDLSTLAATVELFHELPFGRDQSPLISDEILYNGIPQEPFLDLNGDDIWDDGEPFLDVNLNGVWDAGRPGLLDLLGAAETARQSGDLVTARDLVIEFEMEVNDACISESPALPDPTGVGTGIAETDEHPACCKLLSDAEYILSEQL